MVGTGVPLGNQNREAKMIDIKAVKDQAVKEVTEEKQKKAVAALKGKMRQLEDARQIVRNIEREIEDLEASLADGSFAA
jgi:uncharacterized membrane protein